MSDSDQHILQEIFLQAIEIPEAERNLWLDKHCIDQWVRNEVEELLKFHFQNSLAIDKGALPQSTHATVQRIGPKELHTTCPHCGKQIAVLAESLLTSITCLDCKKTFSLVDGLGTNDNDVATIKVGRFELLSQLGEGAFGSVWMAHDPELERKVALKLPRNGRLGPLEAELFFREARAAAQLHHPNIVPIHEVGRDGDAVFIVSELVRGTDLEDWLSTNQLSNRDASQLCRTIALALHHAHGQGVIHRDLKPSNIMIDGDDKPYLMDFGLAKRESQEIAMTVEGQPIGTPSYMSPEQAAGNSQRTDRRTDIYSLGVLLFRVLTGELPYRGNPNVQMQKRQTEDAPDPRRLSPQIPRDLATVCLKCLEREKNKRYNSAQDVGDELSRFLEGKPIVARPISAVDRAYRLAKRNRAATIAVTLTTFFAVAGPLFAISYRSQNIALEREKKQKESSIIGNRVEKEGDTREIDRWQKLAERLQKQLNLKEGKANPWEVLPKSEGYKPNRKKLISKFYAKTTRSITESLRGKNIGQLEYAQSHFGLALLAEALDISEEAYKHYDHTIQSLQLLIQKSPKNPRLQGALALSKIYLSRCATDGSRKAAFDQLSSAGEILKKMVGSGIEDASYKIELAEVELLLASMPDFTSPGNHLAQIARINSDLNNTWPKDATDIYRLACYLTAEYPLLLE